MRPVSRTCAAWLNASRRWDSPAPCQGEDARNIAHRESLGTEDGQEVAGGPFGSLGGEPVGEMGAGLACRVQRRIRRLVDLGDESAGGLAARADDAGTRSMKPAVTAAVGRWKVPDMDPDSRVGALGRLGPSLV